jgi:hypothetical protein
MMATEQTRIKAEDMGRIHACQERFWLSSVVAVRDVIGSEISHIGPSLAVMLPTPRP